MTSPSVRAHRRPALVVRALTAGTLVAGLLLAWGAGGRAASATPGPAPDEPTPGAVSVLDPAYGLHGDPAEDGDATPAFTEAMRDARRSPVRYAAGPTGPQAVVLVPAGTYALGGLVVPSNVRLEVDADAVLQPVQAARVPARLVRRGAVATPVHMLLIGDHGSRPVRNVSVVGVGTGSPDAGLKARAQPTYDGWDISGYFTVDLDSAHSGGPSGYGFAALINVQGFEVRDVYVVQNDTVPWCTTQSSATCPAQGSTYPAPTTGRSAIALKPAHSSGSTSAGPFHDPTDGRLSDIYGVGAPYGFGPTQVTSGHHLQISDLYSEGGTALRLETDDAAPARYLGELADVTARHVVGERCNRAVAFAAHRQDNRDVAVSDVTAVGCQSGLVQSSQAKQGSFTGSSLTGLRVVGADGAQVSTTDDGRWEVARSTEPAEDRVDPSRWAVAVTGLSCSGTFTAPVFDPLLLDGTWQAPVCGDAGSQAPDGLSGR